MRNPGPADWPTRIMLAVGIVSTLVVLALALFVLDNQPMFDPMFGAGLNGALITGAAGVGLATVGLVWMVRIFRGPRDEPPAWRHRDR